MDAADVSDALRSGELRLSGRQLPEVPQLVFACCGLLVLDLSANSLTSLPVALGELKSLTSLDVSFNQLHELPACLGALTVLTCLRAQYNQIERVHPQTFSGLGGCLVELHLGDNALGSLPAEVGCLSRLARLDLRYTRLTELPAELSRLGDVGCLQQLGLEGCPLGAAQEGRPEGRPATAGTPREQQQALYRRIRKAAADTEAAAGGAVAGQALAEVLKQLGTTAQAGGAGHEAAAGRGAGSSTGGVGSRSQPPAAAGPGAGSAAASTGAPAAGGAARKVNVLSLGSGGSGAGATSSSGPGGGGGVGGGGREQGDASRGTAAEPNAGSGPRYAQLQPLQLHSAAAPEPGPAARGSGGGDVRAQGPPRRQHQGAVPPRSPLTDLRNSHADLELSYVDEDDDEPADDEGINIVGPGGAGAAPPLSPGELSPGGFAPRAMALALEELSELPPAAAAVMYRSLDMVAAGVQEMREGRPLSRGGTSAGVPLPPNAMRPASSSRPGSQHRRPGSSSSYGDPLRPRTSSSASGLPGSAGGGAPRQPPGEELTGAMALLASVGMRAGGSGGQGAGGTPGRRNPGGDSDAGCGEGSGLGALAPITFPLASGVRGMLRGVSGGRQGGGCGTAREQAGGGGQGQGEAPAGGRGPAAAASSASGGWSNRGGEGGEAGVEGRAGGGEAGGGGSSLAAELDQLQVVRRLLAGRHPDLLRALDEQVFEGEEEAGAGEGRTR